MRVFVVNSARSFEVAPGQSVLEAALRAGLNLPHSCRGGNCGSCRARLVAGQIDYPVGAPLGLSAEERHDGLVLLCQAQARSDLTLELTEVRSASEHGPKRLPCRIERLQVLASDVMGVFLRLPAAEEFRFEPGQYLDMLLPQGRRRSFSIASPPHAAHLLELHVRKVAGGLFSEKLFQGLSSGALLNIEGPLGNFRFHAGSRAPLLLVGGGTGFAPLKSILRHVLETGIERPVTLYWGVRQRADLYEHTLLTDYLERHPRFRYLPVLSEPEPDWNGRVGLVHAAVLEDLGRDLRGHDIYTAGPPPMIQAIRQEFVAYGADPERLYHDSFDYARDP